MSDAATPQGAQGRAYPGVALRILDETGADTSGTGEIWVQSPYLFDGYASETTKGAEMRDGYVSVGEIGHLDPQGNLFLTGRKARRVTIADQTIYPDAIEAHLMAQPQMPLCVVMPLQDDLRGQRLGVVVEGAQDQTLAQNVRQSCRERFGALATPARVVFIDELPLLPSGKTDLSALATWLETQT
jgi:long-chain acyl-CoA synthetase